MSWVKSRWRDLLAILILEIAILCLFHPLIQDKVAMNGAGLVAYFSPWRFDTFAEYPAGVPAKPGMPDQLRLYLPYMRLTLDEWRAGHIPLWNPYNFAGNPQMAEMQSAVFYPLNFFMLFLDLIPFWHLMIITGYLLGTSLMYVFLRSKVGIVASMLGSVAWGLSLYMITHTQEVVTEPHAFAYLPLLLLVVDRLRENIALRWWILGLTGSVGALFTGYIQTVTYVFVVTGLYALYPFGWRKTDWMRISAVLSFGLVALLIAAVQLLPAYELFQISSRHVVEFRGSLEQYLLPWYVLLTLLIPDFFGHPTTWNQYVYGVGSYYERALSIGIVPLFFAVVWWLNRKRGPAAGNFFSIVGLIALLLVFNLPMSHVLFWTDIPFFSTMITNRLLFVSAFCLSTLSAFGMDAWINRQVSWRSIAGTGGGFIVVFLLVFMYLGSARLFGFEGDGFGDASIWTRVAFRNMAIPLGVAVVTIGFSAFGTVRHRTRPVIASILVGIAFAQSAYSFYRFTPFSDKQFFYPTHSMITFLQENAGLYRFWGYGDAFFDNNFATMYGVYAPEGYDSLNSFRYAQLLYAMQDGRLHTDISRSDAGMSRAPDGIWNVHEHPRRKRLWSMLGVKYILDKAGEVENSIFSEQGRFTTPEFRWAYRAGKWQIAEFLDVYPRAYLASDVVVETDDQKIIDLLFHPNFSPRKTLVLEEELTSDFVLDPHTGSVEITLYTPTEITINVSARSNQLLFLSDQYNEGWKAYVDGRAEKIYRANFAFRAVPVGPGEHTVVFSYEPRSFDRGKTVSLVGLGIVGIVSGGFFVISQKRKK